MPYSTVCTVETFFEKARCMTTIAGLYWCKYRRPTVSEMTRLISINTWKTKDKLHNGFGWPLLQPWPRYSMTHSMVSKLSSYKPHSSQDSLAASHRRVRDLLDIIPESVAVFWVQGSGSVTETS